MSQYTHNFRAQDSHLDPPNIPDVEDDQELLSNCCGANPWNELDEYNMAICSCCKEHALFTTDGEDD